MIFIGRIGTAACAVTLVVAMLSALETASAQGAHIVAIEKRYRQLFEHGDYAGALIEARKLEAAVKTQFGSHHFNYAVALRKIAEVYEAQGKLSEAEGLFKRTLAIVERARGSGHVDVATVLHVLGNVYRSQAKYGQAEPVFEQALAIKEKALGLDHVDVGKIVGNLAAVYQNQGRYRDAEEFHKRELVIFEKALEPIDPTVTIALINLAGLYLNQARYGEAEGLYKRALANREKTLGLDHPLTASPLFSLAAVYGSEGKFGEAESLLKRALAIWERTLGPSHPDVASALNNLGAGYSTQGKYTEAERLFLRALTIREKALGASHPDVAATLNNLGAMYQAQGKYEKAEGLYHRALAIKEQALGASHPHVAVTLNDLAAHYGAIGNTQNALVFSRKATAAVIAHGATEAWGAQQKTSGLFEQRAQYFHGHVSHLAAAARQGKESEVALGREAIEIAQWGNQSSAAAAVQQMATRFASGGGALAILVRESQDLSAFWRDRDKALIEARSKPEAQQDRAAVEALRKQIADVEGRLASLHARLEKEFPDHAALANPKPLRAEDVQKLLSADEVVVFFVTGEKESYIFALTRESFEWKTIALGENELSEKIAAFRRGLDVDALQKSSDGKGNLFDLAVAHELYGVLIAPVETLIKEKGHLLVVPSGVLTALPVHLLVTDKPAIAAPEKISDYRDAAWLLKRHAVTVLPSVASLRALRAFARNDQGSKPMIGFGDPIFGAEKLAASAVAAADGPAKAAARTAAKTRAYTDYWKGAGVDREKLAQALPRLEDTADELRAVAQKLGAPESDIYLRAAASETTIKRANAQYKLADYRVVYFATHGLVAGDIKGLAEPSLALTLPKDATDEDDGLLTASEITQLKLKADWVVLSACNTIAGEKPGAEALSGLARAFFYAGARALLVTHWAVDSEAATRLTTSTFDILKADPKLGRAEALRRAMLAYMNDSSRPQNAYPAYWAPFSIIGEGAAR
jgi:CHAT domain-containing protein/Tfp pilus assembly protein PilF